MEMEVGRWEGEPECSSPTLLTAHVLSSLPQRRPSWALMGEEVWSSGTEEAGFGRCRGGSAWLCCVTGRGPCLPGAVFLGENPQSIVGSWGGIHFLGSAVGYK